VHATATETALDFDLALSAIADAVGPRQVFKQDNMCARYARTTLPEGTRPEAIVRPSCTAEVQAVLQTANQYGLQVHPISTGKNWGYGDACAQSSGHIILDLRRMNRIIEVNAELAYAIIEPGVTQGQLLEYLEKHDLPLWMDATGAGPDTSLIGNTMERGFGHSPYGDRFQHCCDFEVVLPTGELLRTGFGHYEHAQAAAVYKNGVGPAIDGLFTQSNLGVVTRMTFWLMRKPEVFEAAFFSIADDTHLGELVNALRELRLDGSVRSTVHLANDLRLISMFDPWPETTTPRTEALSAQECQRLRIRHGVGAWSGSCGLYGTAQEVAAMRKAIRSKLKRVPGLERLHFLSERQLNWGRRAAEWMQYLGLANHLKPMLEKARMGFDLLKGKSPSVCAQGGLWRSREPGTKLAGIGQDPLEAQAGFIWCAPVLPATAAHADRVCELAGSVMRRHGFDCLNTLSFVNPRALCAVLTICFDRRSPEECRRASACHAELQEALMHEGYIPYRGGRTSMNALTRHSSGFFDFLQTMKKQLDPQQVLAPGHYIPA
jgi:4-cresol dehydrogenase (hydroxylating)